jgi:hypothetical protein
MLQVGGARYPNKLICQSTYACQEKKTNQMPYPTCACATAAEIFLVATEQPSGGVRPVLIQPNSGYINKPRDQAAQQTHAKNTTPPGCREKSQRSCATIIKKEEHRQALAPFPVFRKPSWHKPATWKMVSTSFIGKRHG